MEFHDAEPERVHGSFQRALAAAEAKTWHPSPEKNLDAWPELWADDGVNYYHVALRLIGKFLID